MALYRTYVDEVGNSRLSGLASLLTGGIRSSRSRPAE